MSVEPEQARVAPPQTGHLRADVSEQIVVGLRKAVHLVSQLQGPLVKKGEHRISNTSSKVSSDWRKLGQEKGGLASPSRPPPSLPSVTMTS